MVPGPLPAVDLIGEQLERRQRDQTMTRDPADSNKENIWFEVMGGAVGDVATDATAFAHRDATFVAQFQSRWNTDAPEDVRAANIEWLRAAYAALAPFHSSGAYVDYTDPDLDRWGQEYYAQNLRRLKRVKVQYDPHNFFNSPQSISST